MRLDTIFLARAAVGTGGELSVLGMGVTRLKPTTLPWQEPSLAVVVVFTGEDSDFKRNQALKARFLDPNGERMPGSIDWTADAEGLRRQAEESASGEPRIMNFIAEISDAVFTMPGLHHVVISVEGEEVARAPLYVFAPEPGQTENT